MISTLKVQTPETDLIEKIKAAIKKRAEAKAKLPSFDTVRAHYRVVAVSI